MSYSESNAVEVDQAIRALMDEINALNENAMPPPPPPDPSPSSVKPKSKKKPPVGWTVNTEVPTDSPMLSWSDGNCLYTVKNPANYGNVLLKLSVFHNGRPTHSCGLYLEEIDEAYKRLNDLVTLLENMWVDHETGVPKVDGIARTVTPLPAWRKINDCTTDGKDGKQIGGKRKASDDCVIQSVSKRKKPEAGKRKKSHITPQQTIDPPVKQQ